MAGSTYGNIFKITTWGESHGKALGVVIDGTPAGLSLSNEDIQVFLDRRRPGQSQFTTQRNEADTAEILSGVFEGTTTGTPISIMVRNTDHHSTDYSNICDVYRPGHADYTFSAKYGIRDFRGGGRSSGRETIGRVAAGAVASKILGELGITLTTYVYSIGPITISESRKDLSAINSNSLYMPDNVAADEAASYLASLMEDKNSAGGVVECIIENVPAGLGDTVFEKLDANLSKAISSIGGVKGVEIGDGFKSAHLTGQENNDQFCTDENGFIIKKTNHSGGILGGMSDGSPIIIRAAFKPTPSIAASQLTVNDKGENITIEIKGRHDPLIAPRGVVVVESMAAITLVDSLFINASAKMQTLKDIYK